MPADNATPRAAPPSLPAGAQTLASIERAVALRLAVDDPPVPAHVRQTLLPCVQQVCALALAHASAAGADGADHAQHVEEEEEASGMQL